MKSFITGIDGFIGSFLAEQLLKEGVSVAGIVKEPDRTANLRHLASNLILFQCDVTDGSRLRGLLSETKYELVFHLAAQPNVPLSWKEPKVTFETNVMGTLNLLESLRELDQDPVVVVASLQNVDIIAVAMSRHAGLTKEAAGIYAAAALLGKIPVFVVMALTTVLFPYVSRANAEGNEYEAVRALKSGLIIAFPLATALAVLPQLGVDTLLPPSYTGTTTILPLLAPALGMVALMIIMINVLQAQRRAWVAAVPALLAACVQGLLLAILLPRFGTRGAATSTLLGASLGLVGLALLLWKSLGGWQLLRRAYLYLLAFGLYLATLWFFPHPNPPMGLVALVVALLGYGVALVALRVVSREEVRALTAVVPQLRSLWSSRS